MKRCFHCKQELQLEGKPARGSECPFCSTDLKVCLNCRFHDSSAHNECREPVAEPVKVKDRANFCEYFEFKDSNADEKSEDPMKKLEDLFKN